MSATLCCYPNIPRKGIDFSYEVKCAISRKYCDTDGTTGYDIVLNNNDVVYLEGLRDGGLKEIDKMLAMIKKYGSVTLKWEH